ncbi:hypothetical protein [Empedobacter falsenii]
MKYKILVFTLILSSFSFSQKQENIFLQWKIAKNDTLKYQTTMHAIKAENKIIEKKDSSSIFHEFGKFKDALFQINSNIKYQTNLYLNKKNENLIDIEMFMLNNESNQYLEKLMNEANLENQKKDKKKQKKVKTENNDIENLNFDNIFKNLIDSNNNVVLRGRISKTGEIISTYYKNSQKNLISILFSLPNKEVEIGEKWKLNLNLIEMDQNFVADNTSNQNTVYIEKIIHQNNDQIAVIKYDINEYVLGDFNTPMAEMFGMKNNEKIYMKTSFIATGYFSLLKGKWTNYEGEMEIDSNFSMLGGKSKTEFKLIE